MVDSAGAGGVAIRGGLLRTSGYVVAMMLSLVSVPLMVRHLGVAAYGQYMTVSAIVFIIGGITEGGLTNLGVREFTVLAPADRDELMRNLAGLRFALTTAGIAVAVAFAAVTGADRVVVEGTAVYGIGLLVTLTQQTYAIPLLAQLRLGWVSALELLKQATLTVLIVVLVMLGAPLLPFFATPIGAAVVVLLVTLALIRHVAPLRPRFDLVQWRRLLREVMPYAAAAAVGLIYFRLTVILMSYVASAHETGIYATAFRIVEVVAVIPWLVVSSAFPILARAARDDALRLRYALQRMFEVSTTVGVGLALGLALGAQPAVSVIGGPGFEEAVPVLRLLAVATLTSFLVATWSFGLLSLKAQRALLVCNAIAAAAAASCALLLTPRFGAEGGAIATVGAEAILAIAYALALGRARRDLRPQVRGLERTVAAAAVGALAALLPAPPAFQAAAGGMAYLGMLVALRAFPPELVTAVLRKDPGRSDLATDDAIRRPNLAETYVDARSAARPQSGEAQ